MRSIAPPGCVVLVFGDGGLPEVLLACSQFRLVADLAALDRAPPFHLLQLGRHIEPGGCRGCRGHLAARVGEQAVRERRRRPGPG